MGNGMNGFVEEYGVKEIIERWYEYEKEKHGWYQLGDDGFEGWSNRNGEVKRNRLGKDWVGVIV